VIIQRAADARAISGAIYPGIDSYGNATEKAIDQRNYGLPVIRISRINIDRRRRKDGRR